MSDAIDDQSEVGEVDEVVDEESMNCEDLLVTIAYQAMTQGVSADELQELYLMAGQEAAWSAAELAKEIEKETDNNEQETSGATNE